MDRQGGNALFRRLRVRLTLATGAVLVAMACAVLAVAQGQLAARGESAFRNDVNAILYHLSGQTVVDHTWLAQTEAGGGLVVYVELSGVPLLYPGWGEEQRRLIGLAEETALQEYGFALDIPPASRYQMEQVELMFRDDGGQRYRAAAARLYQGRGWIGVLVLRSMAQEEGDLLVQRMAFAGAAAAGLALLALLAWQFTRWALKPLAENRARQNAFIAAASHELRSPLAVIRASLSALRGAPPEEAERFVRLADGECIRMTRLVGDMLALANADSGNWTMQAEETEPETLLLDAVEAFERVAREKGIHMAVSLPEAPLPRCRWDRQRIRQVLSILIDNALSYTPAGGRLCLSASGTEENMVRFAVVDSGPGIPDGEKEAVFERFYRTDRARSDREHYGLGLCIAQEIVSLHHGRIFVEDGPEGGAAFLVELPVGEGAERQGRAPSGRFTIS